MNFDVLIIGGGIYGLFCARYLSNAGKKVLLIEMDENFLGRASFVNQARLHNGYHYPRSIETASIAHKYYEKFKTDFSESINDVFDHIYAVSQIDSLTSDSKFVDFCKTIGIPCEKISENEYFKKDSVVNAYMVTECAFDYKKIREKLLTKAKYETILNTQVKSIQERSDHYDIRLSGGENVSCEGVINTTYSSINQINKLFGINFIDVKYELCEMVLCDAPAFLENKGITIIDGNYFSIMPFGLQGHHSLYSVKHSVHETSWNGLPVFSCQGKKNTCSENQLNNCNSCFSKPKTAFSKMASLSSKYLVDNNIKYRGSIFAVKAVSKDAEHDDARLVSIETHNVSPLFISIFSGKISSIYETINILDGMV